MTQFGSSSEGLDRAIKEVPALAVPILFAPAVLDASTPAVPWFERWPSASRQTGLGLLSTLVGLAMYSLGDFWDSAVFDRLYAPWGRWIARDRRPWFLFPACWPLLYARKQWVHVAQSRDLDGPAGYREASDAVQSAGRSGSTSVPGARAR